MQIKEMQKALWELSALLLSCINLSPVFRAS